MLIVVYLFRVLCDVFVNRLWTTCISIWYSYNKQSFNRSLTTRT